ncbi:MAG TPA: methyltransferase domain-containing protein [Nocardioides sp.]|uniref:class I SAM-dependent methyltransferase n=1 Tax=Nocardioides sp. TaxID=35761 RepID=UPI002E3023FD|nr:methyltransferase domain-containing protein [Nocardioides sp.]HEX5086418.1 methyltransferase domain-containing protein [Nocardioides sp.]
MDPSGWSEATQRAEQTYDSAADRFTAPQLSFWDRWGSETIARTGLRPGQRVLDLCCGAGASAIPAAHAVAPQGSVVGVDVSRGLLDLARARADAEGLTNLELRCADATATGYADGEFDAVVCVFGVFFLPDRAGFTSEMWRMVRPSGGTLAITTWGPGWLEPASSIFWDAVRAEDPSLYKGFNPWDDITEPTALLEVFEAAGVENASAEAVAATHPVPRPEDFWVIVMGSGPRATVDALSPGQADRVHDEVLGKLEERDITEVCVDVVFGAAVKA